MGIIGYPLSHSISPDFQQAALDYCAIDIKTPNLSDLDFNRTYILELNCHPGIHFMLEEKGVDFVRELYKKLLMDVISKYESNLKK